jgi:hypothetical protein
MTPQKAIVPEYPISPTKFAPLFEPLPFERNSPELQPPGNPAAPAERQRDAAMQALPVPRMAESAKSIPMPIPRPRELDPTNPNLDSLPTENRGIFEKLYASPPAPMATLAYAAPETDVIEDSREMPAGIAGAYDKATAVYDISARMLYMPNGTKLEAHSGLGDLLDDPERVNVRMRGATPPAVYELKLREKLFHGVQALRLSPIGNSTPLGRAGLLAHPFMLGPNGDSNGCVSIKDYEAFLQAYIKGEVKRLAVVARLN